MGNFLVILFIIVIIFFFKFIIVNVKGKIWFVKKKLQIKNGGNFRKYRIIFRGEIRQEFFLDFYKRMLYEGDQYFQKYFYSRKDQEFYRVVLQYRICQVKKNFLKFIQELV